MERIIYIAGKQNAAEVAVADFANELEAEGHTVLEKWWEKGVLPKPYLDHLDTSAPAAATMLTAAAQSDVFILFAENNVFGAAVELGAALGSVANHPGKEVYLLKPSDEFRQSIFYGHPALVAINSLDHIRNREWFRRTQ